MGLRLIALVFLVWFAGGQPARAFFVGAGATWKYLDNGSDQGTLWTSPDPGVYDDSLWASGPAELGYGDGDEATTVSYGADANNKQITTYFRHSFEVADSSGIYGLQLDVVRDDGIVVYLNGTEVFRDNMPGGTPGYNTLASGGIGGADESTWLTDTVDPALLVDGTNVLAVEIHQHALTSSDISFNLMLEETVQPNLPPDPPTNASPPSPADGATGVVANPQLCVSVTDPELEPMDVTFYGREMGTGPSEDFSIVVLPDTQFYSQNGGTPSIFEEQTQWIIDNKDALNIVFVAHVGDIVNVPNAAQWIEADEALSLLDPAGDTELMPYGLSVGNHDQSPIGSPGTLADEDSTTALFNQYFGVDRYCPGGICRSYYAGHYGDSNDNSYQLFTAGGMDFITINLEYDQSTIAMIPGPDDGSLTWSVMTWAEGLLATYSDRRAIINSHYIINGSAIRSNQGIRVLNWFQDNDNVFLMVCGHYWQAARLADPTASGDADMDGVCDDPGQYCINTINADYQVLDNGGNGWLRIMTFSPDNDTIRVQTYSPTLDAYIQVCDSSCVCTNHPDNTVGACQNDFVLPYEMQSGLPFHPIGTTQTEVVSGDQVCVNWPGRLPSTEYEWYATVSDATHLTSGSRWTFTSDGSCSGDSDCIDSLFCNGFEACDLGGTNRCFAGSDACPGQLCDEPSDLCVDCSEDADCSDGISCTVDSCDLPAGCTNDATDALCDDGDACSVDACDLGVGGCDYSGICGISGTVYYYRDDSTASEPSTKTVPNVDVDATDDGVLEQVTDGGGIYAIQDLYGSYVVRTLDKYGDPRISDPHNGISSFDASAIAQATVQQITLSTHQQLAADVTGNGQVTSFDASRIAQYAVGQIDHFDVADAAGSDWLFYRCNRYDGASDHDCFGPVYSHAPLTGSVTDDFYAILYGDVTGNWQDPGRSASATAETDAIERDRQQAAALRANPIPAGPRPDELGPARWWISGPFGVIPAGKQWTATLNLSDADGITALDLGLEYDAERVSILAVATGDLASGFVLTGNDLGKRYLVSLFGVLPLEGSGAIVTITLEARKEIRAADALSVTAEANEGRIKLLSTRPQLDRGPRSMNQGGEAAGISSI